MKRLLLRHFLRSPPDTLCFSTGEMPAVTETSFTRLLWRRLFLISPKPGQLLTGCYLSKAAVVFREVHLQLNVQAIKGGGGTQPLRFFRYHTFCIWNKILTFYGSCWGSIRAHLEV